MSYELIGKRDWIKEEFLKQKVEETYLDHLIQFSAFEEMVENEEEYGTIKSHFEDEMSNLLMPENAGENSPEVFEWKIKCNQLKESRENALSDFKKKWFLEHVEDNQ